MSSNTIYHYVYRITNIVEKKHYYGKRSSKCDPKLDLGVKYFSSSTDKEFILNQKNNPQNYKYKIVAKFDSASLAILRESKLHYKFDVAINLKFYNKVKQTFSGFDRTGITDFVTVRDKSGVCFNIHKNDPKYLSGELKHIATNSKLNCILTIDEKGNKRKLDRTDPRLNSGEFKPYNTMANKVIVLDKFGSKLTVSIFDPKYISGEYVHILKGSKKEYNPNKKLKHTITAYDNELLKCVRIPSDVFYNDRKRYFGSKKAKNLGLI